MKFVIVIHQEKILELMPDARLEDAAFVDVLHVLAAAASPRIEQERVTGPDGLRYTWIDYGMLIREVPMLRAVSVSTMSRIVARIEKAGFIRTLQLGRKKYAAPTEVMDCVYIGDNRGKTMGKSPPIVAPVKRNRCTGETIIGPDRCTGATNQYTSNQVTRISGRGGKTPGGRRRTGTAEPVGDIINRTKRT